VTAQPLPTVATTTYRVVSGDTLIGIAGRFQTTVKAIMDLNKLTTTTLRVGQVLQIPTASS
jgi:LysM repeat protein